MIAVSWSALHSSHHSNDTADPSRILFVLGFFFLSVGSPKSHSANKQVDMTSDNDVDRSLAEMGVAIVSQCWDLKLRCDGFL